MSQFYRLGLIGQDIQHSLSPLIHGYWLKEYGFKGSYILLDWDETELEKSISTLRSEGFHGVNVTMPHKTTILRYIDQADPSVHTIKATNTLTFLPYGGIQADNTDVLGLSDVLTKNALHPKKVVIYGAGGAARAAAYALSNYAPQVESIYIIARSPDKVREDFHLISPQIKVGGEESYLRACDSADLFINASPLGMASHSPFSKSLNILSKNSCVIDFVYHPRMTRLLEEARRLEFQTIDGLELLLAQARYSFKHWFQILPEVTLELRYLIEQR